MDVRVGILKKAECWRIDAFKLWCWSRLSRAPQTARRSTQSILKEINPEYSLEGLVASAEAPILWPPDAKSRLIGKDPDAGKNWRQEEKGVTEDERLGSITGSMDTNLIKLWDTLEDRGAWCAAVPGDAKSWTHLSDWTTATKGV